MGTVVFQASQPALGNYAASTSQVSFSVSGESPSLSLPAIGTQLYKAVGPFAVNATSRSPAAITYSVLSGPATVGGNTVTLTGAGTVVLQASQPANGTYAASTAQTSFAVQAQTTNGLTLAAVGNQVYGPMFSIAASSNSPAPITYKVVSGPLWIASQSTAGAQVRPTGVGTVVFQASQVASGNYAASTSQVSFSVSGESPSLSLPTIGTQLYKAVGPFAVNATSRSPAAITYSVLSGPATVTGNTVTLTGAGTVVLQASQPANGTYAADTVQTSFGVQSQTTTGLTLPAVGTQVYGPNFSIAASSNSPAPITYKVVSGPLWIASQSTAGAQVRPTGVGTVVFQASQVASGNYAASTTQVSFSVSGESPSLSLPTIGTQLYKAVGPFAVNATSRSPAAITYSVLSGPATVTGNTVTLAGAGTVVLQASQAANGTYAAATVQTSFAVQAQTVTTLALSSVTIQTQGEPAFPISATSDSPAPIHLQSGERTVVDRLLLAWEGLR